MLSRIAESLYWLGRYGERAEDTARILDVHYHLLLEDQWVEEPAACAALLEVMNKTKYWELYRELYASFGDDDETFKRLFGDEFARAYDEQLRRLTAAAGKR